VNQGGLGHGAVTSPRVRECRCPRLRNETEAEPLGQQASSPYADRATQWTLRLRVSARTGLDSGRRKTRAGASAHPERPAEESKSAYGQLGHRGPSALDRPRAGGNRGFEGETIDRSVAQHPGSAPARRPRAGGQTHEPSSGPVSCLLARPAPLTVEGVERRRANSSRATESTDRGASDRECPRRVRSRS
jgi:hypothetical protein